MKKFLHKRVKSHPRGTSDALSDASDAYTLSNRIQTPLKSTLNARPTHRTFVQTTPAKRPENPAPCKLVPNPPNRQKTQCHQRFHFCVALYSTVQPTLSDNTFKRPHKVTL